MLTEAIGLYLCKITLHGLKQNVQIVSFSSCLVLLIAQVNCCQADPLEKDNQTLLLFIKYWSPVY